MKLNFFKFPERRIKSYSVYFAAPLLCSMVLSAPVQAQLPAPAISIGMVATDFFRNLSRADRNYHIPFNLYSHIGVELNNPVSAERADVYVGFIRPDGVFMTWAEDPMKYVAAFPIVGMQPVARDIPLSDGGFVFPKYGGYLQYIFTSEDIPGIYQWFTLLVRAGKSADDAAQWLTLRTQMLPVK